LSRSSQLETAKELIRYSHRKTITLVYGAADEEHNHAVALKEWLDELSRGAHGFHDGTV
jgi:uncharacterized protein YeaO (DUF488 family)